MKSFNDFVWGLVSHLRHAGGTGFALTLAGLSASTSNNLERGPDQWQEATNRSTAASKSVRPNILKKATSNTEFRKKKPNGVLGPRSTRPTAAARKVDPERA